MATRPETVTIRNKTGKPIEFMWNYETYYMDKDQEWTLDKPTGMILANKYFDQLEAVGEGAVLTLPPLDDPNQGKSYAQMHPTQYGAKAESKPWCRTCGKVFKSGGQLMMHRKKHEKEDRLKQEAEPVVA